MSRGRLGVAALVAAFVAVVAGVVAAPGSGSSRAPVSPPFAVSWTFDRSGNPVATVNSDSPIVVNWSVCRPPSTGICRPIPSRHGQARPGPEPAGTIFRVVDSSHGHSSSLSGRWGGAIHAVTIPVLHGEPTYGATVSAGGSRWVGGWVGTFTRQDLQNGIGPETLRAVIACRSASGTGCVTLSGEALDCSSAGCVDFGGLAGPGAVTDPQVGYWLTGRYLFAVNARLPQSLSEIVGFSSYADIPVWKPSATVVRSLPSGPVIGPPPAQVRFPPVASIDGDRLDVASVTCTVTCNVAVDVQPAHPTVAPRGGWSAAQAVTGTETISVPGPVPTGRLKVSISIGGSPPIDGTTQVTAPPDWSDELAEYLARGTEDLAENNWTPQNGFRHLSDYARAGGVAARPGHGAWLSAVQANKTSFSVTATSTTGRRFTSSQAHHGGKILRTCTPTGGTCPNGHWFIQY